jgi:hypothetical protein
VGRDDIYRKLADAEVERHRVDLLYADRQALKQGAHHAVIARLRRRKYISLCLMIAWAALMVVLGGVMNRLTALVLLGLSVQEYVQAKRTEETLERLARELDAARGDGA